MFDKLIQLKVDGIASSQHEEMFVMVMSEVQGPRCMPIAIGLLEANTVLAFREKINWPRPLPHHLIAGVAGAFEIEIKRVVIDYYDKGVYTAKIEFVRDGIIALVDSRTSDAVALALLSNCPIYATVEVFEKVALPSKPGHYVSLRKEAEPLSEATDEALHFALRSAIEREDYEQAADIKKEINRRNTNNN